MPSYQPSADGGGSADPRCAGRCLDVESYQRAVAEKLAHPGLGVMQVMRPGPRATEGPDGVVEPGQPGAPHCRGWAAYYRHVVSSRTFNDLDDYLWKLTYKWVKYTHPHKPKKWIN